MPVLEGRLVRLEPLTEGHLAALEEVACDERIWRYFLTRVRNRDELRGWIEGTLRAKEGGTVLPWVTVLKDEGRVVGSTRFLDLDLTHKTVEIGHTWIAPKYQGAGVNPEAKLLQLRFAFEDLGMRRVALKTHHENFQSQAAMRKLGAVEEGRFRNHYIMPDGSTRHTVWFSIVREEWPEVRARLEERLEVN